MTIKLYDKNAYLNQFDSKVVSCIKSDDGKYELELSQTAFFPTSGGQSGDIGYIEDTCVFETKYKDKEETIIVHVVDKPFNIGVTVACKLDFEKRYRKMQNHTGEHIISALVHNKYGFENVGFHLSNNFFTCDYNGEISLEDLKTLECEVNSIIYKMKNVTTYYPDKSILPSIEYRSKKELLNEVRIVEIEGVDKCACCAPHVKNTGEIGIFKILDAIKYKGGIRLTCKCGYDAFEDYKSRLEMEREIGKELSSPSNELYSSVHALKDTIVKNRIQISSLKNKIIDLIVETTPFDEEISVKYVEGFGTDYLRLLCNKIISKTNGICLAISENGQFYSFVCTSKSFDLLTIKDKLLNSLGGKCGGSKNMIQGNLQSSKDDIISWFTKENIYD